MLTNDSRPEQVGILIRTYLNDRILDHYPQGEMRRTRNINDSQHSVFCAYADGAHQLSPTALLHQFTTPNLSSWLSGKRFHKFKCVGALFCRELLSAERP
jgi:hypothetical protein